MPKLKRCWRSKDIDWEYLHVPEANSREIVAMCVANELNKTLRNSMHVQFAIDYKDHPNLDGDWAAHSANPSMMMVQFDVDDNASYTESEMWSEGPVWHFDLEEAVDYFLEGNISGPSNNQKLRGCEEIRNARALARKLIGLAQKLDDHIEPEQDKEAS